MAKNQFLHQKNVFWCKNWFFVIFENANNVFLYFWNCTFFLILEHCAPPQNEGPVTPPHYTPPIYTTQIRNFHPKKTTQFCAIWNNWSLLLYFIINNNNILYIHLICILYLLYLDYTVIFSWCIIIIFRKKEIISKEFKNLGSLQYFMVLNRKWNIPKFPKSKSDRTINITK